MGKKIHLLYFRKTCVAVLLALIVSSCINGEVKEKLKFAEEQIWEQPDSVLKVLETIPIPETLRGKEQADYALLLTQAQYRCNVPVTSDSLINIAVEYYKDKNVDKRAAALLFKGEVFRGMKKDEDAMLLFKQTEFYIPQLKDLRIKSRIYNSLAYLNQYHNNFSLASHYYKKAMEVDGASHFVGWHANDLMNLANLSYYWGDKDSASLYYTKLLEMIPLVDSMLQSQIYYNIGFCSKLEQNWEKAEKYVLRSLELRAFQGDKLYKSQVLLADIYTNLGKKAKVDSLWNNALQISDMAVRTRIYYNLYIEALKKKQYEQAILQIERYIPAADSFRTQVNQAEVLEIQKKYDHATLLRKNAEIRSRWYATALIALLIIIALLILIYVSRHISQKEKFRLLGKNERKVAQLQEMIDRYQLKIEEDDTLHKDEKEGLLKDLVSLKKEKEDKDIQIQCLREGIGLKDLNIPREIIESMQVVMRIKSEDNPSYIPAEDRGKLKCWLDAVYYRFGTRLIEIYGLTEREQDVCYLKALELSDDEIAQLLKILPRSIDRCVSRIRMKVGFKEGRKEFAAFITIFKHL